LDPGNHGWRWVVEILKGGKHWQAARGVNVSDVRAAFSLVDERAAGHLHGRCSSLRMTTSVHAAAGSLPFKISVLVFIKDAHGRHLMLRRNKAPNRDCWSPVGGKLEMSLGESPFECAIRETREETGLRLAAADLHLFGMVSERGYEGACHWLMFLFDCHKPVPAQPVDIDEGVFGLFGRDAVDALALPASDRVLVWPVYDKYRRSFLAYRAEFGSGSPGVAVLHVDESQLCPHIPDMP
jgi:8-oxo-dGTP diphosphatase